MLRLLACPSCRIGFDAVIHAGEVERIDFGFLRCPRCAVVVPVLDGFVMFTEPLLHEGLATPSALRAMALRLFGDEPGFRAYQRDKRQRGVIESYAAFAPFNESTRSIEPILPLAVASMREGDVILDTWCRTGYSGEWLAGRFPRQRVVSLWEGNSSVLGYRGFRHLLGSGQRANNLDIVFCTLEKPLPFRDGAFGLVHAYDSLHRYGLSPFAGECLRVARDDAAILFPHLHLSNSEPEPFFERGCHQYHGRDYRAWLDQVAGNGQRRGWVMDEARVFNGPDVAELIDEPDTTHYNGMVVILPEPLAGQASRFVGTGGFPDPDTLDAVVITALDPSRSLAAAGVPRVPATIREAVGRVFLAPDGGVDIAATGESTDPVQAGNDASYLTDVIDKATSLNLGFVKIRLFSPVKVRPEGAQVKGDLHLTQAEIDRLLTIADTVMPR